MIALSLFPQSVDLSVPNKSMLLFLFFLLTLHRPPLRPFLSDNEPGMLLSWACVGLRLGWKQELHGPKQRVSELPLTFPPGWVHHGHFSSA